MIVRIHDGEGARDWMIPALADQPTDYVFIDSVAGPSGPIELVDPSTCEILATADPPKDGSALVVRYWQEYQGNSERWILEARVDTLLFPPTKPLASGTYCPEAT